MRKSLLSMTTTAIALVAVLHTETAQAGPIHASALVQGTNFDFQEGATLAIAREEFSFPGPPAYAERAFATASGSIGAFVGVSFGIAASDPSNSAVRGWATWTDQVILSGPANTDWPTYVDMSFSAAGNASLVDGVNTSYISVGANGGSSSFASIYYINRSNEFMQTFGAWDTLTFGGGSFSGTYHIRVGISPDGLGNYVGDWNFGIQGELNGRGEIGGGDPPAISFTAVTLPDGRTPEEAGLSLRFESGIASPNGVTAVPEPASLTLLGLGALSVLGYARRRGKAAASS